ncbi:hypothetical protein N2152v2_005413 [Parachlorella kessleri]
MKGMPRERDVRGCGKDACGSEGKVLGVKAVPAPSKVDYGHTVSQLLSWSQLVECRKAFQLWYCPVGGKGALPNAVYSDNAGVALVRRCFPFGHAGTALHGYPGLRYMEVAILAPAKHTVDCLETAMSAAALPAQLCDVCSQGSVGRQRQQCGVSLGVVESRQGLRMLRHGLQLGYYSGEWEGSMQSVGYHAAEGRLFPGPHDSRWQWDGQPIGRTFGPGDVAGVGVDLQRQLVFFTLNGAVVGAAVPGGMGRLQGTLPVGVFNSDSAAITPEIESIPFVAPEDCTAPPGQLIGINRSSPPSPLDAFRCAGCSREVCQGPGGCVEYQWRNQPGGYLREVLTAKVYNIAIETPLVKAETLSEQLGNNIMLKREDLQAMRSFKVRGAYNKMARLTKEQLEKGVICTSAGNHAQGVALAAKSLNSPEIKVNAVRRLGGEVELVGESFYEAMQHALKRSIKEGRIFINAYDDPYTIAGQGTIGQEILRQTDMDDLDMIFVAVGGGGMIAGIAAVVKALKPHIKIIGVEPAGANAMAQSLVRGERVTLSKVDAFADGVAIKLPGAESFRLCRELLDGMVLVDNSAVSTAIKDVFNEVRSILEPAGAVALAGAKAYLQRYQVKGKNVVVVTSGANMNFDRLRLVLDLADVGSAESMLAVTIPEEPGLLLKLLTATTVGQGIDITECKFRGKHGGKGHVLFSVGVAPGSREHRAMLQRMAAAGIQALDISEVDLAQVHLRQMVGGAQSLHHEHLFEATYPEQQGQLHYLLSKLSPRWNITALHFRKTGNRSATALVGLQVAEEELPEFWAAVGELNTDFRVEELSGKTLEAFKMFVQAGYRQLLLGVCAVTALAGTLHYFIHLSTGIVARCATTGEISFIDGGARHQFTGDVYQMYGAPLIQVNETGECELLLSCPVGGFVPEPAKPGKFRYGRCSLSEGDVVRCRMTGAIYRIEKGRRRQFSAEAFAAYLSPPVVLDEAGTCTRTFTCPAGKPMSAPSYSGRCQIDDNTIAVCETTGLISLIEDGTRRPFSGEVYTAYGMPPAAVKETGSCPRLMSCPPGEPVPLPDFSVACPRDSTIMHCATTGEISVVEDGTRRWFTAEIYQAYGSPTIWLKDKGACEKVVACPYGLPVKAPEVTPGSCPIPDGTLVKCNSTLGIYAIKRGMRQKYSRELYAANSSPKLDITEGGTCPLVFSCPPGGALPAVE